MKSKSEYHWGRKMKYLRISLLSFLIIVTVVGMFLGFYLGISQKGDIVISGFSIFEWGMIVLSAAMFLIVLFYIISMFYNKKKVGNLQFNVYKTISSQQKKAMIVLACVALFEIVLMILKTSIVSFLSAFIVFAMAILIGMNNINRFSGLGENGVFFQGLTFQWSAVRFFSFENDHTLSITYTKMSFGKQYDRTIRVQIDPQKKNEIKNYLQEKTKRL